MNKLHILLIIIVFLSSCQSSIISNSDIRSEAVNKSLMVEIKQCEESFGSARSKCMDKFAIEYIQTVYADPEVSERQIIMITDDFVRVKYLVKKRNIEIELIVDEPNNSLFTNRTKQITYGTVALAILFGASKLIQAANGIPPIF